MKYIGNYASWIQEEWISEIKSRPGFEGKIVPTSNSNKNRADEYEIAVKAGWHPSKIYWWRYTNEITTFDITNPPWINSTNRITWWIVKQSPGELQPMHVDVDSQNKCKRYWMAFQDYESGHILINEDVLLTHYKKGDVYEFDTSLDYHGSANLGRTPRIVLLITEHL